MSRLVLLFYGLCVFSTISGRNGTVNWQERQPLKTSYIGNYSTDGTIKRYYILFKPQPITQDMLGDLERLLWRCDRQRVSLRDIGHYVSSQRQFTAGNIWEIEGMKPMAYREGSGVVIITDLYNQVVRTRRSTDRGTEMLVPVVSPHDR
eukprot:scaffold178907_cov36-Prasinocladus_malaysianus.AAC.1